MPNKVRELALVNCKLWTFSDSFSPIGLMKFIQLDIVFVESHFRVSHFIFLNIKKIQGHTIEAVKSA